MLKQKDLKAEHKELREIIKKSFIEPHMRIKDLEEACEYLFECYKSKYADDFCIYFVDVIKGLLSELKSQISDEEYSSLINKIPSLVTLLDRIPMSVPKYQ